MLRIAKMHKIFIHFFLQYQEALYLIWILSIQHDFSVPKPGQTFPLSYDSFITLTFLLVMFSIKYFD